MERLDFASVMAVLRRNIPDENFENQTDFIYSLFLDVNLRPQSAMDFDQGQVCRWINGLARLSPNIISFYQDIFNQRKLVSRIKNVLLPLMPDSAMAAQELYDLVLQAPNVSPQKKMELTDGYTFEDDNDEAIFIMEILCLAMQLRFEKRDVRKKQLLTPGNLSPVVVDYIFDTDIPRPCRWFLGREQELEQLHALLVDHSKVFLHGIPGIGKSELAKAYAKQYGKEYTNVIYVKYPGDLKQAVIDLDFADDLPDESDDARFKRHNRFLRSLREDTLLIMDNFNATASQDQFLDVMLKYRCRILFTTRSRYENHIMLEVGELNLGTLLELMGKFFPEAERKQDEIGQIIDLLHGHTFAVELAARLLANGLLKPKALLIKLQKEKAALDTEDKIGITKDGRNKKATYYDHIHSLFSFYKLSGAEQEILRCMTLIPVKGISSRRFAAWMKQQSMNTINDLMEMGFVHPKNDREILLHPMIREVAVEELKPSVRSCSVLLDSLQEISLMHGLEFMNNKQVFYTIESIITTVKKDDTARYLLFLENVFQYMDKYRYEPGMQVIIEELTAILADNSVGTAADRACLLDARAVLEKNTKKKIGLVQEAIAKAVKNTVPALAEAMETVRRNMLIFRYQILHTKSSRRSIKNTLADVMPMLQQYSDVAGQIKTLSRDRKDLLDEKKTTSMLNIIKQRELARQIAKLSEDIEELRSEKAIILSRFDKTDDDDMKEVKKWVASMESSLQRLEQTEAKYQAELDAALAQFRELAGEAESMDKADLHNHRQLLRKPNTQDARSRLQQAHGKQYSVFTMMEAEQDVENLLREDEKRMEPPARILPARQQPEPRKKLPNRDYEK